MKFKHQIIKLWSLICLLIIPLAFTACQTTSRSNDANAALRTDNGFEFYRATANASAQNIPTSKKDPGTFRTGDGLSMRIFGVEDTDIEVIIGSDGLVEFPVVGERQVVGKTPSELRKELKAIYGKDYFVNPTVIVTREAVPIEPIGKIVLDGFVREPGIHEIFDTVTLREALAMAGGLTEDANPERVIVARLDGQDRIALEYSLNRIREKGAPDPVILAGDVIYVDDDKGKIFWREIIRTSPLLTLFTGL